MCKGKITEPENTESPIESPAVESTEEVEPEQLAAVVEVEKTKAQLEGENKRLRGQVTQFQRQVDKLTTRLAKAEGRQKDSTCQHCGGDGCPACDARLQD